MGCSCLVQWALPPPPSAAAALHQVTHGSQGLVHGLVGFGRSFHCNSCVQTAASTMFTCVQKSTMSTLFGLMRGMRELRRGGALVVVWE